MQVYPINGQMRGFPCMWYRWQECEYTTRLHHGATLTGWHHLHETVPLGCRPIPELTIAVMTRAPHTAILLQHHAVVTACRDRLGTCMHDRWTNPVDGDGGMAIMGLGGEACVYLLCVFVCGRGRLRLGLGGVGKGMLPCV